MASVRASLANGWAQLSRVNSCHSRLKRPRGLLKLNTTITAIGVNR
jgi:hypothetical protein